MEKEEFLEKHCGTFDNTGTWRVFFKDEKLSDLNEVIRGELIKHTRRFYADKETCIHNVNEYLKSQQR